MKAKDVANQNDLNWEIFEPFLNKYYSSQINESLLFETTFKDGADVNAIVEDYKKRLDAKLAENKIKSEEKAVIDARRTKAESDKRDELANMLITSGFNFDGYTITKYSGYISGDDAISVNRGMAIFGTGIDIKDKLMESLVIIRRNALRELKEAAHALGCNAVIGVDFDYLTLDPQTANLGGGTTYQPYVFGVTANGNAVIIEKNN